MMHTDGTYVKIPPLAHKSRKVEQGDATREALLAVARRFFGDHGYAGTSLDEIARAAGVTKGALYHHFSGKHALFLAVFEAVKKELSFAAFPMHGQRGGVPQDNPEVWRDLISRCRAFIEAHTEPRTQRIVLVDARSVLSWEEWHKVENEHGVVALRGDLRRAMHRGLIAPADLNWLAMIVSGALTEACMLVANAEERGPAIDKAMGIIERLLQGLQPPAVA